MATLISCATGNFTAAGTWALSDATALLDSEAANTANTTAYVESAAFTPGAITIDGIAVKLASRVASPTGTITVRLAQGGADVVGTPVTINVSDLPTASTTGNEGGWILFKFAAPVLLIVATAYTVSIKGSVNAEFNLYRNGTAGNWSRQLRTTTTQAPVAGDVMHIMGEHTGAATGNTLTVTMDQTATTDYGAGTDSVVCLSVNKRGVLTYGTTAATNYYLKLSGDCILYNGGTFSIGTTGTPIPRDSTAVLEFDPAADGGMGLIIRNGSTFNSQGLSRTSGKNVVFCKLNADASASATTVTVDTDTGWLSGDTIVLGKTTRAASTQTESKVLNGNAGASTIDITVGLTNARLGTAPRQAPIGLLTRNVKIRSATSTLATYVNAKASSVVDIDWTEFRYLGHTTAGRRSIEIETTSSGSFSMEYSSEYDSRNWGVLTTGSATDNITIRNNIFYNLNSLKATGINPFQVSTTTGVASIYSNNAFFACSSFNTSFATLYLQDLGNTCDNNTINDSVTGNAVMLVENATILSFDDNEISGSQNIGLNVFTAGLTGSIGNIKIWNGSASGIQFTNPASDITFESPIIFGNTTTNILFASTSITNLVFNSATIASTTAAATTNGIQLGTNSAVNNLIFNNSTFGIAAGVYIAHTNDILLNSNISSETLFNNCNFGAATLVSNQSGLNNTGIIRFHKHNQTENNHIWYGKNIIGRSTGTGLTDTTIRTSGSLGVRLLGSSLTTANTWSFNILAPASSIVNFFGYFQKNAAFGTDVCTIDLYLPGSTSPDDTVNLSDVTGSWQGISLAATYTGTVDAYATVVISAKTATSAAYIYCDDFFNADTSKAAKIAALDVWDRGKPPTLIVSQAITAADVWSYDVSNLTTANTTGKQLKSTLTVAKFLGLK